MRYIIESNALGNARILALQSDGTYRSIASLVGDDGLKEAKTMVEKANQDGAPKAGY